MGAFPNGRSALMLVTARLKYVAENEWGPRRYLDVTLLEGWPRRRADLWGCRKERKNLDSTGLNVLILQPAASERRLSYAERLVTFP